MSDKEFKNHCAEIVLRDMDEKNFQLGAWHSLQLRSWSCRRPPTRLRPSEQPLLFRPPI